MSAKVIADLGTVFLKFKICFGSERMLVVPAERGLGAAARWGFRLKQQRGGRGCAGTGGTGVARQLRNKAPATAARCFDGLKRVQWTRHFSVEHGQAL